METAKARSWFRENRRSYVAFTSLLHEAVENIVRSEEIDYLSVTSRTKTVDSFVKKMALKAYKKAEEATDLAAIRVVTFIEPEAARVAALLRASFTTHAEKSLDKTEELGEREVGYRSIHIVCELGPDRLALPEYRRYKGFLFEIQVRTVLQHAWAEIDHDRAYKFAGTLPAALRRRLNILAAQLEGADQEFARVVRDIETYVKEARAKEISGRSDVALSSTNTKDYLGIVAKQVMPMAISTSDPDRFSSVIDELNDFKVSTISDLRELFSPDFLATARKIGGATTEIGLLRKAMVYADVDRYFRNAWSQRWQGMTPSTREMIRAKWGESKAEEVARLVRRAGSN